MKVIYKATGDFVNFDSYDGTTGEAKISDPAGNSSIVNIDDLVFLSAAQTRTDWEQRRYELSKEAMGALLSSPTYRLCANNNCYDPETGSPEVIAQEAVLYADVLINELTKI